MFLNRKISVMVSDSEKYGFTPAEYYPVIGTKNIKYKKDGEIHSEYQFLVLNNDNRPMLVFFNKTIVRIDPD